MLNLGFENKRGLGFSQRYFKIYFLLVDPIGELARNKNVVDLMRLRL